MVHFFFNIKDHFLKIKYKIEQSLYHWERTTQGPRAKYKQANLLLLEEFVEVDNLKH